MKKRALTKFIAAVLIMTMVLSIAAIADTKSYEVKVDKKAVSLRQMPVSGEGYTQVSFYEFFKSMNKWIGWDKNTKTIYTYYENKKVKVTAGSDVAYIGDKSVKLKAKASYINDRVMVDTEFLTMATGKKIELHTNTKASNQIVKDTKPKSDTVTFKDANGKQMTLKKNPKRVVCLYNSFLDLWYLCGGTVVGRIDSDKNIPQASKDTEVVGTMTSPNVEKILALKPDLVILRPEMKGQGELIPILEANKIPYAAIDYNFLNEYIEVVRVFTELTERDDLYKKYAKDIKDEIDGIVKSVSKVKKPTVLLMFGSTKSITAKLSNSTVGSMLKDLNALNIADGLNKLNEDTVVFSMEKILELNPDFIFVQTMGDVEKVKEKLLKEVESNPAWSSLSAVKNKRYIYLPSELYLYKANEKYAEAYRNLAKILYPNIIK